MPPGFSWLKGNDLQGQLVICCRFKLDASKRWYLENAFTNRFAWTGTRWVTHIDGVGIRHVASWEHRALAEKHATQQGFMTI
jgi:hypothetical protein